MKSYKELAMNPMTKFIRVILIVLTIFLSLTAMAGGIQLLEGTYAPPVEMLNGIFNDYTIPGLSLGLIVGGGAAFAAVLLFRKSKYSTLFSTTAGIIIMFFEFVEVMVIGSPAGIARNLQIFYFGLGTLIVVSSMAAWFLELRSQPG
jgi:hypothetical protein